MVARVSSFSLFIRYHHHQCSIPMALAQYNHPVPLITTASCSIRSSLYQQSTHPPLLYSGCFSLSHYCQFRRPPPHLPPSGLCFPSTHFLSLLQSNLHNLLHTIVSRYCHHLPNGDRRAYRPNSASKLKRLRHASSDDTSKLTRTSKCLARRYEQPKKTSKRLARRFYRLKEKLIWRPLPT